MYDGHLTHRELLNPSVTVCQNKKGCSRVLPLRVQTLLGQVPEININNAIIFHILVL